MIEDMRQRQLNQYFGNRIVVPISSLLQTLNSSLLKTFYCIFLVLQNDNPHFS